VKEEAGFVLFREKKGGVFLKEEENVIFLKIFFPPSVTCSLKMFYVSMKRYYSLLHFLASKPLISVFLCHNRF
jgi:hypothetical protein